MTHPKPNAQTSPAIFLDDGGVMNENQRRGDQWRRLIGEFFVPRYGGTPEAWTTANIHVFEAEMQHYRENVWGRTDLDYCEYWRESEIRWLTGMFEGVGIEPPPYSERAAIARESGQWITLRVRATFPGVSETVRTLWKQGYPLYTASGERSWELKGYLTGMGVLNCFREFYGPDLINTPKEGAAFYERIFADAGIAPQHTIVVDDNPLALKWAAEVGATVVQVCSGEHAPAVACHIERLSELPQIFEGKQ